MNRQFCVCLFSLYIVFLNVTIRKLYNCEYLFLILLRCTSRHTLYVLNRVSLAPSVSRKRAASPELNLLMINSLYHTQALLNTIHDLRFAITTQHPPYDPVNTSLCCVSSDCSSNRSHTHENCTYVFQTKSFAVARLMKQLL